VTRREGVVSALRIGSLCTGYAGLDVAVQAVIGGEHAWMAENDPHASKVLAHHWPAVPNLGDITAVDWTGVEPVDIIAAGFPCTDLSYAGRGEGIQEGNRSGLWYPIADALGVLRPRLVVLENVAAIVARRPGLDVVLADLARLGFDAEWTCVRAADIGAAHGRNRWFLAAYSADLGHQRGRDARSGRARPAYGRIAAADAQGARREGTQPEPARRRPERGGGAAADAQGDGRGEGRPEPTRQLGRSDAALGGPAAAADTDRDGLPRRPERDRPALGGEGGHEQRRVDPLRRVLDWGPYDPAIRRWEHVLGRSAPRPTEPGRSGERLSPVFVEWLMGLPVGHVTDVPGISRNAQLRLLGNGVVLQQGEAALRLLMERRAAA
jgi:DNA (cytosine-5)-methyltransferase 1